jgi:hypothetical protein
VVGQLPQHCWSQPLVTVEEADDLVLIDRHIRAAGASDVRAAA